MRGHSRFLLGLTALATSLAAAPLHVWSQEAVGAPVSLLEAEPAAAPEAATPPASAPAAAPASIPVTPRPAAALAGPAVRVRAGTHPDFDRIVFDWPRPIDYSVSRDGGRVTIRFAAPAAVVPAGLSLLTRLRDFRAGIDPNGNLAVSFSVAPQAKLKDFVSDKSIVVDIAGGAAPAKASAAIAGAAPVAARSVAAPATAPQAPASAAIAAAPKPIEPKPVEAKLAEPKPAPVAAVEQPKPEPVAPAPEAPKAAAKPVIELPAAPAVKPATFATPVTPAAAALAPASDDKPQLVATFDPHTAIGAAIWQRAGIGTIVFDRKLTLSLDALTQGAPSKVALTPVELGKATGFRFPVPDHMELHIAAEDTAWKIYLAREADLPVAGTLVPQPDFALGARYILPVSNPPEPVHLTDPLVGDELIALPLVDARAFSAGLRMADFLVLPAAQGLVLKPLTDRLIVRRVTDGIEITGEGGLHLSSAADTGAAQQSPQKARAQAAGKSIFDFTNWRGKPGESFTRTRQRLQQTVIDVPDRERIRARMELARFYFAHGYGEEAAAILALLVKQAPDLKAHADFLALMGAAKILAYRPVEGLQDLTDSGMQGQPEVGLWQAAALAETRHWGDAEERFAAAETQLAGYPEPFYSRFSVLAVEAALATNNHDEAGRWLKRLKDDPHSELATPAIDYLEGVVLAQGGHAETAEQKWRAAAASHDRLYKVRAELALIDLGVANGSLTAAHAADRLEALRFGWRGDDLEVDILHRLGQFYLEAQNIKSGLAVFNQLTALYPNSPMAPAIKLEMAQIFHDVFLGNLGKKLSPLDALTLYQQYRNLMPTGSDGTDVTRNLAERLVAIDLLGQAGDLLDDLVKTKLQGEDRARTGSRLAAIRLLDHRPEDALAALDASNGDTLPAELIAERMLLRAKALADTHKEDEALALVKDNAAPAGKMLRADILMRAQRWPDAARALVDLAGPPPKAGQALTPEQADNLVNAAIAYSLANDQTGLDKLAIDYDAAMNGNPQADTFRILTRPEKTAQLRDIRAVQSRIADVDMFQSFLNNYRKADGTAAAAVTPAAKP